MSRTLNPKTICNIYTLEEIETEVTFWKDQLKNATVKMYDKDSTQGRQKVESADIDKIESTLSVWLKALECKKGLGGVNIVSANFGGHY